MDPSIPIILRMRRGAGWFLTIALLSGVNSVLQIFDAKIRFMKHVQSITPPRKESLLTGEEKGPALCGPY